MKVYYTDSSALVKRYVQETGSVWIETICDPSSDNIIVVALIGLVEVASALSIKCRQGILPTSIRDNLLQDLQGDAQSQYWLIEVNQTIISQAIDLTRRYKLRGYDAVHLASFLFLQQTLMTHHNLVPILLSADEELLVAAQSEGLVTDNPNNH